MSVQATNLYLMYSWELAYAFAGEAVLPLFGLSGRDINAVLTVDVATKSQWAASSPALALPRPGLLPALRGNDQPRLRDYTTQGPGRATALTITRLVQPMNVHLLTVWQQAASEPERDRRQPAAAQGGNRTRRARRRRGGAAGGLQIAAGVPRGSGRGSIGAVLRAESRLVRLIVHGGLRRGWMRR